MPEVLPITSSTYRREFDRIINRRVKRRTALFNMLFPASTFKPLTTETAQIDVKTGALGMAPFVKVGTKAILMDRRNGESYTITTPFINMKAALTWTIDLFVRQAGGAVFASEGPGSLVSQIQEVIAEDTDDLNERIDQREEWMAAMMLRGGFSYAQEGGDNFILSTGKPDANTYTVANLWSGGSARPDADIKDAKILISGGAARGPAPTVAICGEAAAAALQSLVYAGTLKPTIGSNSGVDFGRADLRAVIEENGMIFLGRYEEIDFFQYLGTFQPDDGGALEPLIRSEYIEYFSTAPSAADMRRVNFGRMPDFDLVMKGESVAQRHLAIKPPEVDQGTYESVLKSRPLTWFYRPDWYVSQKVV